MNKLETIRKVLEENTEIAIVEIEDHGFFLPGPSDVGHEVDIGIAPKKDRYAVGKLQTLLSELTTVLGIENKPLIYELEQMQEKYIFVLISLTEEIGSEHIDREITLTDKTLFKSNGFVDGKQTINQSSSILRRIRIFAYPDIEGAKNAFGSHAPVRQLPNELVSC